MKKNAIILAAGEGNRMRSAIPKQFLLINKKPILIHVLEKFTDFDKVIIAINKKQIKYWKEICKKYNVKCPHLISNGGKTRFHSVKNALDKVDDHAIIAIHDAARPIVTKQLITKLISSVSEGTGAVPMIQINDSIRKINGDNTITVNRENILMVQTPQCFIAKDIKKSYRVKYSKRFTDDASVFEADGGAIKQIEGEISNIKITNKQDLKIINAIIN